MGKTLLILPEQGFGDQIQLVRYAGVLKHRGAKRITLVCKPEIRAIFESVEGIDSVISTIVFNTSRCQAHDFWRYIHSIPFLPGTTAATIPASLPYLSVPKKRIENWSRRLPKSGLKIAGRSSAPARHPACSTNAHAMQSRQQKSGRSRFFVQYAGAGPN
ncbi:hypothetical protein PQQ73_32350 [Paraburkholderia strydomiana]|uniref:Glycosyltransferase subfamily 4-like N-terminal domain-containing protein n=1 Tax=Paraburkholderia strydomiana TaxID=1245417 RepID=A0ABW9EQ08_9BURK